MGQNEVEEVKREVEKEVDEAFVFARGSAFPKAEDLLDYVFKK